ncbi:MAG TPA: hypothetical protein VFJ47_08030, partial [Terriglobales bacterium]|nr:hypothetical protein [Terriglobales bacterium]
MTCWVEHIVVAVFVAGEQSSVRGSGSGTRRSRQKDGGHIRPCPCDFSTRKLHPIHGDAHFASFYRDQQVVLVDVVVRKRVSGGPRNTV